MSATIRDGRGWCSFARTTGGDGVDRRASRFTELLRSGEVALTQAVFICAMLRIMKYLPSTLLIAALALALHAQTPQPQAPQTGGGAASPTPAAVPPGDPFVKNPG